MDQPLIELHAADVAPTPAGEARVRDVSWTVKRGEWWVVAGPPNCGKSALLMTLGVLLPPARGELKLFGQVIHPEMGDALGPVRRQVGLFLEGGGHLFERSTVLENVALPIRYHENLALDDSAQHVESLLEACGLADLGDQTIRHLGRAQRRRVSLARALALKPEVLLIDNPVAGLDPSQVRWWRGFLSQLNAGHPLMGNRPMTLVVATDDLRPWLPLGQQFALVRDHTLTVLGDRNELRSHHADLLTHLLDEEQS